MHLPRCLHLEISVSPSMPETGQAPFLQFLKLPCLCMYCPVTSTESTLWFYASCGINTLTTLVIHPQQTTAGGCSWHYIGFCTVDGRGLGGVFKIFLRKHWEMWHFSMDNNNNERSITLPLAYMHMVIIGITIMLSLLCKAQGLL